MLLVNWNRSKIIPLKKSEHLFYSAHETGPRPTLPANHRQKLRGKRDHRLTPLIANLGDESIVYPTIEDCGIRANNSDYRKARSLIKVPSSARICLLGGSPYRFFLP